MKHLSKYNESEEISRSRQYIENKCIEEIKDVFTDVSDEVSRFNVRVNSRDTRGRTEYEVQFTHRVSFYETANIEELKGYYAGVYKIQMDTFDSMIRLEKMGYITYNKGFSITSESTYCGLSAKIHLWK